MHGTAFSPEATKVEFDADLMWVTLEDGRVRGVPLAWFPRLLNGSPDARLDCFLSPSGIHWDALDEDIAISTLLKERLENSAPAKAA